MRRAKQLARGRLVLGGLALVLHRLALGVHARNHFPHFPHADPGGGFEIAPGLVDPFGPLPTRPPEGTTVSPRRMFFTSSAWSFTFFCCGRRIRKYMITKISANGSSDISMLLVSPPAAAWANAGVISIRAILVKRV